jgi:chemotaxis protein MotB
MASKSNQRPIVIRRVRKKVVAGHHGGAWKVAYADFVTAMMAFFMLLWLLANPDKERLKGIAQYFSPESPSAQSTSLGEASGLGGRTRRAQSDSSEANGQPTIESASAGTARGGSAQVPESSMRVMAEELRIALDTLPQPTETKRNIRLDSDREGLRVNLMDSAQRPMFRPGTAELNDYGRMLLSKVARSLIKSGSRVAIEGHTDAIGGQSDANWRLSGNRALAARSAMLAAGLTPDRFSEVVAMAGSQPIYPDQPERPENRRITVVVLAEAPPVPAHESFKF